MRTLIKASSTHSREQLLNAYYAAVCENDFNTISRFATTIFRDALHGACHCAAYGVQRRH